MKAELADIFKRLSSRLRESGEVQSVTIGGEFFRIYQLSEISLQVETISGRERPDGISFNVFNEDMFLSPDGQISVTDENQVGGSVYVLRDADTLQALYAFLRWRLSVLNRLGF